jgi:hypothetical protein
MVNIGGSPLMNLLAIALIGCGAGLYFLRSFRPGLTRDYDIFFAAVGLLCGGILFFQGWRLDPILQFSQFLLAGTTVFFGLESIRLRGVTTEQAKREAPIVDEERPVSKVYRAELDELQYSDDHPLGRRMRSSRSGRSVYPNDTYYDEDDRRRAPSRSSRNVERLEPVERLERPRKRRSQPEAFLPPEQPMDDQGFFNSEDDYPPRRSRSSNLSRSDEGRSGTRTSRSRRNRSSQPSLSASLEPGPTRSQPDDYVDYRPVSRKFDEEDIYSDT